MDINGFHLELTNICTLKCPGCARTQFRNIMPHHWQNKSLDIDSALRFMDIDLTNKEILLCGNTGDPIYHPDFHNVLKKLKATGAVLRIATNGSYKNKQWWKQTVDILDADDEIEFSVDGLPSNFTTYRVNGDWDSIQIGMQVVAQAKCKSNWSFIPFNYNENDIDEARELCYKIGLDNFEVAPSDRWDKHVEHLKPSNKYVKTEYNRIKQWKETLQFGKIKPRCSNGINHFITAEGYYTPCCFSADFRYYYKTPFGNDKESYNIATTTITKIMEYDQLKTFTSNFKDYKICQYTCGTCST